jgi:hypothetical protein
MVAKAQAVLSEPKLLRAMFDRQPLDRHPRQPSGTWSIRKPEGCSGLTRIRPNAEHTAGLAAPASKFDFFLQFDGIDRVSNICGIHSNQFDMLTFGPGCPEQSGPSHFIGRGEHLAGPARSLSG